MKLKTILIIALIVIGISIMLINIPKGELKLETPDSSWYICQAEVPLCQMERANSCSSYKVICAKCCDEWGLGRKEI